MRTCVDCKEEIEGRKIKLPNGLYACEKCYSIRNPLARFSAARNVYRRRYLLRRLNRIDDEQLREMDRMGEPPPQHKIYKHPMIQMAYRMLLKGKKVDVGNRIEGR